MNSKSFVKRFLRKRNSNPKIIEKPKVRTFEEIRARRDELIGIREEWRQNGDNTRVDIDDIIHELNCLLGNDEEEKKREKTVTEYEKEIAELRKLVKNLEIQVQVLKRD